MYNVDTVIIAVVNVGVNFINFATIVDIVVVVV